MSICTTCGYQGNPNTRTKGNFFLELALWLLIIIPGIIYSLWRLTTKEQVCPKCKNATMIPIDTPQGQLLANKTVAAGQSVEVK